MQLGGDFSKKSQQMSHPNRTEIAASLHLRQQLHWRVRQKSHVLLYYMKFSRRFNFNCAILKNFAILGKYYDMMVPVNILHRPRNSDRSTGLHGSVLNNVAAIEKFKSLVELN